LNTRGNLGLVVVCRAPMIVMKPTASEIPSRQLTGNHALISSGIPIQTVDSHGDAIDTSASTKAIRVDEYLRTLFTSSTKRMPITIP
jgi:hypothetical protein